MKLQELVFMFFVPSKKAFVVFRSVWARLIQKVFEVNPLECPHCSCEMGIKSFIFNREELVRIIAWMTLKGKPPPVKKLRKAG